MSPPLAPRLPPRSGLSPSCSSIPSSWTSAESVRVHGGRSSRSRNIPRRNTRALLGRRRLGRVDDSDASRFDAALVDVRVEPAMRRDPRRVVRTPPPRGCSRPGRAFATCHRRRCAPSGVCSTSPKRVQVFVAGFWFWRSRDIEARRPALFQRAECVATPAPTPRATMPMIARHGLVAPAATVVSGSRARPARRVSAMKTRPMFTFLAAVRARTFCASSPAPRVPRSHRPAAPAWSAAPPPRTRSTRTIPPRTDATS